MVQRDITTLEIEAITEQTFAPYGVLLEKPSIAADISKPGLKYWHRISELGFSDEPVWGYLEVYERDMQFEELERHCQADEVFIATGGPSIMPFATGGEPDNADARPDADTVKAFYLPAGCGLTIRRGIWHTVPFPLEGKARFVLSLDSRTPEHDLDFRKVGPHRVRQTV